MYPAVNKIYFFIAAIMTSIILAKVRKEFIRVLDGIDDIHSEFPYVAALVFESDKVFLRACTGSLITESWVLTAAHCFFYPEIKITRIRYGDMTVDQANASYSKVKKSIPHPSASARVLNYGKGVGVHSNDIGLLLVEKVLLNTYGKVSAVDYQALIGYPVRYAGLGRTFRLDDERLSPVDIIELRKKDQMRQLQIGEAVVVKCVRLEGAPWSLLGPLICLAPKCARRQQLSHHGDSGGPLIQHGRITGVCQGASGYKGKDVKYTPVSPYLDWIYITMSRENANNNHK